MKKYIVLFSAVLLFGTMCSCEDKQDVSEPVGDNTAPAATEETTEWTHLELAEADFTTVQIASDTVTDMLPPEIQSADLSDISFGARMSPCKDRDICTDYKRWNAEYSDEDHQKRYDDSVNELLDTPCEGFVVRGVCDDGRFYFAVQYDDWCGQHDSALYCYDIKTDECRELISHTGLDNNVSFEELTCVHGKLAYFGNDHSSVYLFDPESGEEKEIYAYGADTENGNGYIHYIIESDKGFRFMYEDSESIGAFKGYDMETGELSDQENLDDQRYEYKVYCDGVPAEVTGGFDGEKYVPITVETQYYTLSSELTDYSDIFLWRDKVCIVEVNPYGSNWLHTYDISAHEHLKMKIGFTWMSFIKTDKGLIATGQATDQSRSNWYSNPGLVRLYYVDPLLGTVYRFGEGASLITGKSGNTAYFLMEKADEVDKARLPVGFYSGNKYTPDKLYWFESMNGLDGMILWLDGMILS